MIIYDDCLISNFSKQETNNEEFMKVRGIIYVSTYICKVSQSLEQFLIHKEYIHLYVHIYVTLYRGKKFPSSNFSKILKYYV